MEKEAKQSRNVSHKSFLIILKYLPYAVSFGYCINTFASYFNYDLIGIGYILHLAVIPWIYMILASFVFKFCYVHRLPLYYVLVNDVLNITDYYIGIPIDVARLFQLHLVVVFIFISLYIYGYVKRIKNFIKVDK